jgi:hypothetical protein
VVHDAVQLLDGALGRDGSESPVDLREVDALRDRRCPPVLLHHRGDHGDLFGRHGAVLEGRGEGGQVLQRPAVADQLPGGGGAEATVAAQPRLHGLQSVLLGSLLELRSPHSPRQLRVEPVLCLEQLGDPVELLPRPQTPDVVDSQGVEGRPQLTHDHLPAVRTCVRRIPRQWRARSMNPQVSGLFTLGPLVLTRGNP